MTTFPLFQLPSLAMEHVLYMMNPYELINISRISSRSKRVVKRIKCKFSIFLIISNEPCIIIFGKQKSWTFNWVSYESVSGYEEYTKFDNIYHKINKYSETPIEELLKLSDYIREVFGSQRHCVQFHLSLFPNQNKFITDWLSPYSMACIDISSDDKDNDDDLKYVVSNVNVIDSMTLEISNYKEDFQMEIPSTPYDVLINDSSFIKLEQVLRLENRRICLCLSRLTAKEINGFLKSWMSCESHFDLEAFDINISGPEAMDVIMDLLHEETADPNVVKTFRDKFYRPEIQEGFDIKRCDGTVATVCYGRHSCGPRFFMLVR
uniref:F-box domain-containing protein n=1 Tax=Caenorhabditis tropicalis TaxID=1561998 RepID=A0A1I7TH76_9PELO